MGWIIMDTCIILVTCITTHTNTYFKKGQGVGVAYVTYMNYITYTHYTNYIPHPIPHCTSYAKT